MIKISYRDENGMITLAAAGHAGYAEPGKDVVCAGVSALMQTLAIYAGEQKGSEVKGGEPGHGYLRVDMRKNRETTLVVAAILSGLYAIAKVHPGHVAVEG